MDWTYWPEGGAAPITVALEDGVLNDEAVRVFTEGHCGSLAAAVCKEGGFCWTVFFPVPGGGFHIFAADGETWYDANGQHDEYELIEQHDGVEGEWVSVEDLPERAALLGIPVEAEAARPFAKTLLADCGVA